MKNKKLLAIILLSLSFCFVSGVGYGEIDEWILEIKAREIDVRLVGALVSYIMFEKDSFLRVSYYYDETGGWAEKFPVGVKTRGKFVIFVLDSRGFFVGKVGKMLLFEFEKQLLHIKYVLGYMCSDLDTDVVIRVMDDYGNPLGYFYEGEYHLWEE